VDRHPRVQPLGYTLSQLTTTVATRGRQRTDKSAGGFGAPPHKTSIAAQLSGRTPVLRDYVVRSEPRRVTLGISKEGVIEDGGFSAPINGNAACPS
jgi:hypothetical protein